MWAYLPCSHPSVKQFWKHTRITSISRNYHFKIYFVTINSNLAKWTQMIALLSWKDWRDWLIISFPIEFHSRIWESALFEVTEGKDLTNEAATEMHGFDRMDSLLLVLSKSTREALKSGLRNILKWGV